MTSTSTLAHSSLSTVSPMRSPGHSTPNHGSRCNTPVRLKVLGQAPPDAHFNPFTLDQTRAPSGIVRRTSSASPLERLEFGSTAAPSNGRRRRLSVTSYRDASPLTACDPYSPTIVDDFLSRRQLLASPLSVTTGRQAPPLSASLPVLSLQLPLSAYVVLEQADLVASAAAHVLDPSVRCVVVVASSGSPTHIVNRQDVEQLACRCHDPFSDTLGSHLADTGAPHCSAVGSGATVGQAAGLLLLSEAEASNRLTVGGGIRNHSNSNRDYLVVVDPVNRRVLGLVSRSDLATALLGGGSHVQDGLVGGPASGSGATRAGGRGSDAPASPSRRSADGTGSAQSWCEGELQQRQQHKHLQRQQSGCVTSASANVTKLSQHQMPPSAAAAAAAAAPETADVAPAGSDAHATVTIHAGTLSAAAVATGSLLAAGLKEATSHPQQHQQPGLLPAVEGDGGGSAGEAAEPRSSDVTTDSAASGSIDGVRMMPDPVRSGWDMLDTMDDALDVLGLVGRAVNAEAVGRKLLGDVVSGAANVVGGSSSTGWLFKYLYDGDCAICRTFQSMLEKLDNSLGRLAFVDISSPAFNSLDHGGISVRAALETLHILSANGEIFKGVTALIKLLAAVDPDWAANSSGLMAALPLISLSYMVLSRHRKRLSTAWGAVLQSAGLEGAGGDISGRGEEDPGPLGTGVGELRRSVRGGSGGGSEAADEEGLRSHLLRPSGSGAM